MKRSIVVLVALGLIAGSLAAPVEAKKKKKKPKTPPAVTLVPAELKFFPHYPPDGATPEGCTSTQSMDLKDTVDTTCSNSTQVAQEVFAAAGEELISYVYPSTEGTPFILDASRKLTGEVTLRGTFSVNAKAELLLAGTVGGAEAVIAEGETGMGNGIASNTAQGVELPGPAVTVPIEIEIDKALDKLEVTTLTLTITVRGVHRGHVDLDRNPTHIIVPVFQQQ
jgi:hypothetical protein